MEKLLWTNERIHEHLTDAANGGYDISVDGAAFSAMRMRDEYETHRGWMDVEIDRLRALLPPANVIFAIDDALPDMMHASEVIEWLDRLKREVGDNDS